MKLKKLTIRIALAAAFVWGCAVLPTGPAGAQSTAVHVHAAHSHHH
jgi:hypothetical protein